METTPLIIAFTPNYFLPAATTLKSIFDSTASKGKYEVICLVSEDIPKRMQDKLVSLVGDKMSFRYLNLRGKLKDVYIDPRYSEAASYRLLLPTILPEYDVVAYIDCDVIARNDIADLYNATDLGQNYLAAVYEAPIENQGERFKALGCNPNTYFNSGFLLMNLKQMREDNIVEKLMHASKVDYLEFPDQDVLNQVCQGRVVPLSPIYNSIRTFFLPQYKSDFIKQYSEKQWKEVQEHGTIHYTGGKPWNLFTVMFAQWWDCYNTLPIVIKSEWTANKRMERLASIYATGFGRFVIDKFQSAYRKIKY